MVIIHQVDAFTDVPFRGNPAAVCLLSGPREESWLRNVAQEMNLAETAYLWRVADGYDLRWFTPTTEVDLCGHATLASAHVLYETGVLAQGDIARFHTRSGLLTARTVQDGIELDFPAEPAEAEPPPPALVQALGARPVWFGRNRLDFLMEVETESAVRSLEPDFTLLKRLTLKEQPARGVIVTARSAGPEFDFVSRFFAPAAGVDEDPVTGSAHCCLGPFWASRLGRRELRAYQASARGGWLQVKVGDDRVKLVGQAVTVLRAELLS